MTGMVATQGGGAKLLRRSAAARRLGIHPSTLDQLAHEGSVHYVVMPGRRGERRYRPEDIDALLTERPAAAS